MIKFKKVLSALLAACMVAASLPGGMAPTAVYAVGLSTQTSPLDTTGSLGSDDSRGYSWDAAKKELTLKDGFYLKNSNDTSALRMMADATIILEGTATIESENTGIEAQGNLTICSKDHAKACLKVKLNNTGSNPNFLYGVRMENTAATLTVKDNTILQVNGGYCNIACTDTSTGGSTTVQANLDIRDRSVVQLTGAGDGGIAKDFRLHNTEERIIKAVGAGSGSSAVSLLKKNADVTDFGSGALTLMSCRLPGDKDLGTTQTSFSLTYNAEEHPVVANANEDILAAADQAIPQIKIKVFNSSTGLFSSSATLLDT